MRLWAFAEMDAYLLVIEPMSVTLKNVIGALKWVCISGLVVRSFVIMQTCLRVVVSSV